MPLSDFPKAKREILIRTILDRMTTFDMSPREAALIIFTDTSPYACARAEFIMDELWDQGLVCCMGAFRNYAYQLTNTGREFLHGQTH